MAKKRHKTNQDYTKNLLLEQSFLKSIFGGFFDFLRNTMKNSKSFASKNYSQFKKNSDKDVVTIKEYFEWLNENLPLEEEELYYIPEDNVKPSNFDKKDFISPLKFMAFKEKKILDISSP